MAISVALMLCYIVISLLLLSALVLCLYYCFQKRTSYKHIPSLHQKHVVITGGSSGIGYAIAKECLSRGASVTLMARNSARLSNAAKSLSSAVRDVGGGVCNRIFIKAVDVTDANAVAAAIQDSFRWKPIDILICNAGIVMPGLFDTIKLDILDAVTKTNLLGCAYVVHAALPLMKARSHQHRCSIVLISSISSLFFLFGYNMYTSSKYSLRGLAELLRFELLPYDIKVSLVCPSFTKTPMLDLEDNEEMARIIAVIRKIHFYNRAKAQPAEEVAALAIKGMMQGEFLVTTDIWGFLFGIMARGYIPPESFTRGLIELFLLVPLRLASYVWLAYMKRVLRRTHEEGLL